jgi:conjugal transfer pilus assembly protein TraB
MIDKLKSFWVNFTKTNHQNIADRLIEPEQNAKEVLTPSQVAIKVKSQHRLIVLAFFGVLIISWMFWLKYQGAGNHRPQGEDSKSMIKLEIASTALDIDKMWRNHFEDKLVDSKTKADEKLQLIEHSLNEQGANYQAQLTSEMEKLKAQIEYLVKEQSIARREVEEVKLHSQQEGQSAKHSERHVEDSRVVVNQLDRGEMFDIPKSARHFIPETGYVTGVLLGGIAVSTSVGSSSEPVPVIIRITGRGNLPKNFAINLTHCQIMGSSYGDLSSERAVIRAEVLSCRDERTELIYTTRVVGVVYGDDGMNGIKGRVVQTSGKHLKNALVGSMISGFAQIAQRQEQLSVTSLGAVSTSQQSLGQLAQNGALAGSSSAAEKISDYYIKQAESMSPVLLIAGGTKVDIVFTKGVYLGALDVQEKLEQHRKNKVKK